MKEEVTGGCQCGDIRFRVAIENDDAYLCHCRMCQRATGGVSMAFKSVPIASVTWTTREPDRYRSSPIAQRGFCARCGTPLTFEFIEPGDNMDLTVGSFDQPGRFIPTHHFGVESWHPAWLDTNDLPVIRSEENPNTTERWMKTLGHLPD